MWDFLREIFLGSGSEFVQYANPLLMAIPAIAGLAQSVIGSVSEGKKRREMAREREDWNRENEAWYKKAYNEDYTRRADVQNTIKQMREEMDRQRKINDGRRVVTGGTHEQNLATQQVRNKAMGNLMGNLAGQGTRYKQGLENAYQSRRYGIQSLNYDTMKEQATSSNNLLYGGLKGLAETDWQGIVTSMGK